DEQPTRRSPAQDTPGGRPSRVPVRGTQSPPAPRTAEENGSTRNRETQPNTRQSKRSKKI
ncbi:MAG: hypothetical protein ACTSWF_11720, partial [Candidatus Freyarchaeota archaeon]